jgi:CheY-like chemotaxis protein
MSNEERTMKILVIDDEPDVVSYLEMLLRDAGYETVSAANGRQGMEMARQEKPDLVTLDVSMPEASGTRFYREIKQDPDLAKTPVVIVTAVTGYAGDPYGYEKFLSGRNLVPAPDGFFPKPIEPEPFLAKIRKLLNGASG